MGKKGNKKILDPDDPDYEMVTDESDGKHEEFFSNTEGEDSEGRPKPQRITMFCKYTHYDVVREAGKLDLEYHLTKKEKSDWDIAWYDGPISMKLLKEMNFN